MPAAKGELVLGASHAPPVTRATRRQGRTGPWRRAQVEARASVAARQRGPGASGRSKPDQPARTAAARRTRARASAVARKRRHHSRTVVSGRSRAATIRRTPWPPTLSSSARPMTSTVSQRDGAANQGRRAAVAPHRRQRTRGDEDPAELGVAQVAQVSRPGPGRSTAARAGYPRRCHVTATRRVRADIEPAGPYDHRRWTFAPPRPPRARYPRGVTWFVSGQIIAPAWAACRRPREAREAREGEDCDR